MADVVAVRITNIVSITQGSNKYIGVRSVTVTAEIGALKPVLVEGHLYPTDMENVGTPDFPVGLGVVFEQDGANMLALMAEAKASCVVVYKAAAGGSNKTMTIANNKFRNMSHSQNLQDFGRPSVNSVAHSSDGSTLPISYA